MHKAYLLALKDLKNHAPAYLETIFTLGNGHFGMRATDPLKQTTTGGTIVNGFYETSPITYGESAYGYPALHQTIASLPDLRAIQITDTQGQHFYTEKLLSQTLDLQTGVLTTETALNNATGQQIRLTTEAVIGQDQQSFAALRYTLLPINFSGTIRIEKKFWPVNLRQEKADSRVTHGVDTLHYAMQQTGERQRVSVTTTNSHLRVDLAMSIPPKIGIALKEKMKSSFEVLLAVGPIRKTASAYPDLHLPTSFAAVAESSEQYWKAVWSTGGVDIEGDDNLAQGIHYNLFQLNSSAGRDGMTNIAAKGVSGLGYDGHYFWDTEMYMLPYFILTQPQIARSLLAYRYHILPTARKRARTLGVDQGALFPWRTINGEEASAYYPASTAQYHINGDIAYAVGKYYAATQDFTFMRSMGFEILLETARFWAGLGGWFQNDEGKHFGFFDVTGPDEYTALVDNNFYTNQLAKHNLDLVIHFAKLFKSLDEPFPVPLTDQELDNFQTIADGIYLPVDPDKKVHPQDDSFLHKPLWPFATVPKDKYPLLLHFHPLTIYRYQVDKQADTLLADYLFPEDFSKELIQRDYAYYEPLTTHDSSLSRAIFSAVAARLNMPEKAYSYFTDTARMDLVDLQGNAADGLHVANLGGSWLSIVTGFAGVTYNQEELSITNSLPQTWKRLMFRITYRSRTLSVAMTATDTEVSLLSGKPIVILVNGLRSLIK
ncbi:glycoside hydrolase family 65 protein [Schleiferilactobacillus harbinensis]|uniref:glycoside hydrolase family 65 protein n=1 Tax=Schleiferilactobacillus harbinensis TaxID=304207 RepID=UPI0021A7DA40|nr:glycosyl hydrolase family 65 protein [Schleiferilactobacillus harbinensis]MCT2909591.1 glycoside hydrolase family 65 protein [Schleiferilactobacillus harbinensis]